MHALLLTCREDFSSCQKHKCRKYDTTAGTMVDRARNTLDTAATECFTTIFLLT